MKVGLITHHQSTIQRVLNEKGSAEDLSVTKYEDLIRSPFLQWSIGLVSGCILDRMHSVHLGVVKRLLHPLLGDLDVCAPIRLYSTVRLLYSMRILKIIYRFMKLTDEGVLISLILLAPQIRCTSTMHMLYIFVPLSLYGGMLVKSKIVKKCTITLPVCRTR